METITPYQPPPPPSRKKKNKFFLGDVLGVTHCTLTLIILILQTFASWEVDYLKVDGCFANPASFDVGYPKFSQALNATGRPILLSCEWPDYQTKWGIQVLYQHYI